jgi:hypothetical protein
MAYTTSADLPPALASLLNVGTTPMGPTPPMGIGTAAMAPQMPSFQMGGMVGPGGTPMRPPGMGADVLSGAGGMGAPGLAPPGASQQMLRPEQIIPEAQRFVQQHPQQVQQMLAELQRLLQTGELTREELNMVVQMARSAAQNPALYPQLRRIAIQRGVAEPGEISEEFDPGLVFILVLMGEAMQAGMGGQGGMQGGAIPSFKAGGPVPNKGDSRSDPVVAKLHEGEYVIPAHIVKAKGTEFFDKMLASYTKSGKPKNKMEESDESEEYNDDSSS